MIDWFEVLYNALWIIGCATIVAAYSYTHWMAHVQGVRTRQLLGTPAVQLPFSIGLCMVSLGLFFLSRGWLEHVVWAAFVVLSAWQSWRLWQSGRQ